MDPVQTSGSGRGNHALELIADLGADGAVDRRMRPVGLARPPRADRHPRWRESPCAAGTSPRKGTPSRSASWRAPPWPKMSDLVPQCGHWKVAHVLDDAEHGHVDLLEHRQPRRASISDRSCGVETMTAPFSGTFCASVSCASPVPGGMSTTSTSSVPQTHVAQHLGDRRHHHRPAPDHRGVFLDQEADRHDRQAEAFDRDHLAILGQLRLVADAGQPRHRRAVDVGVEQPDLEAEIAQSRARD